MASSSRPTVVDREGFSRADASDTCCLVVIHGDDIGRRILLTEPRVLFGRDAACAVPVDDETVSRNHAELLLVDDAWVIRDLGSTNGTFVNDEPQKESAVSDGDQIRVGRNIYKFLHGDNVEAQYHEVIYQLMTNDGLTQAHNRRYFTTALQREISRGARYARPLALILFDIDRFKNINDEHGHLGGDEVLRQLAARVNRRVRSEDVFARIGGEEFAILAPEGTREGATFLGERVRTLVADKPFRFEDAEIAVTCSVGVAFMVPSRETTTDDLYAVADARLYRAKELGRNRVVDS